MNKAEELIACLEREIAKRDEELAACRVAVENCEVFRARVAELEDDLKCAHSMLAEVSKAGMALRAELSAIKAQGVVMPEGWIPLTIEHEPGYPEDVAFGPKRMMDRLKKWLDRYFEMRLNTAPVQQVSVPVTGEPSIKCWSCHSVVSLDDRADADGNCPHCRVELDLEEYLRAMLAAAPAAPAADAGLVEALALCVKSLDQLLPYLGKVPADIGLLNDALMAARPALAAHRAQGVV